VCSRRIALLAVVVLACTVSWAGGAGAANETGNSSAFLCPSPEGIDKPPGKALAASVLDRLNEAQYGATTLTKHEVLISPAAGSPLEGVANRCGRLVARRSVWVHVCPSGAPEPCSLKVAPGLSSDVLLVHRNGDWSAWAWLPYGGTNPVPPA